MSRSQSALADRLEIMDLIARYGRAMDDRNLDAALELFTADVDFTYQSGAVHVVGAAALRDFLGEAFATLVGRATTHLMGNTTVQFGDDVADAVTSAIGYLAVGDEIATRGLVYADGLRRVDGAWLIATHRHDVAWEYLTPRSTPQPVIGVIT